MEPIRSFLRHKKAAVKYYEAECTKIDYENKMIYINDESEIKGSTSATEVPFDMLVVGVGAENATFGIPGVREHGCFLKEVPDAQKIRKRIMDCVETATFKDQSPDEVKRLLHMVVVGGGPTGVEFAGELQDFFENDLRKWIPEISNNFHVTLVEALPNVLPMFSKNLIEYTEQTFKEETIDIRTKTMVKRVEEKYIEAEYTDASGKKVLEKIPYGLLVWATGNALKPVVKDLMSQIPAQKDSRRGLAVNEYLVVKGTENIWAVGDCAIANYAPTAQVASQEGAFLARLFNQMAKTDSIETELAELSNVQEKAASKDLQKRLRRVKSIGPFEYSHQGSLAYIGSEKAVADISWLTGNLATGGQLTYFFWRSAYLSMCFSSKFTPKLDCVTRSCFADICPLQRAIGYWLSWIGRRRRFSGGTFHASKGRCETTTCSGWLSFTLLGVQPTAFDLPDSAKSEGRTPGTLSLEFGRVEFGRVGFGGGRRVTTVDGDRRGWRALIG